MTTRRRGVSDAVMSDRTILITVEDLIYTAFGHPQKNIVDFELVQTVLHILARQMRLLEQDVEIKIDEITTEYERAKKARYDDESGTYSSSSAEDGGGAERGRQTDERRERKDRARKKGKEDKKERRDKKERGEKDEKGEKGRRRSKDRGDKDKRSRDRDKRSRDRDKHYNKDGSPRGRRSRDYGDEGGRERGRGRERGGERGADGRWGSGGEREGRDFGRQTSGTSITISEATRRGPGGKGSADKILVAERGPAARVRPARIGSIEVVTASQFALLGKAVKQLEKITGPMPEPVLPDNETLRQDLAMGRASLQDTMKAVELNARVQAAEQGLYRMAELLTQLAQSGMLPAKFADQVGAMEEYLQAAGLSGGKGAEPTESQMDAKKSTATVAADAESEAKEPLTYNNMYEVLNQMKDALFKEINDLTARANHSADMASNTSRIVVEKLDIALEVDARVTTLFQQTADYAEQLGGFDSAIMSQVNNFQEQLGIMRNELAAGLAMLDATNNNAETAALLDLTEHHQELVVELENTVHLHQELQMAQNQISDEIKSLLKCVEMLREQKTDREEVIDGLRDKADLSRLAGLLNDEDFAHARSDIEKRISTCYEVFSKQDMKWRDALKELMIIAGNKSEMIALMSLKDATNTNLNEIHKLLNKLEIMLGEPKAAILMRKLAKDASCAACLTRALMEPEDPTHGKPLPLPALRPPPRGAEQQPCFGEIKLAPPDLRDHICRRWAGGSHTLMSHIAKVKAEYMKLEIKPTKKFVGYGFDGRLYMMAEDMQPCAECNKMSIDAPGQMTPHPSATSGAGDQASALPVL